MLAGAGALTVLLWWGSTGLITGLVRRDPRSYPSLLAATSIIAVIGLAVLVGVREDTRAVAAIEDVHGDKPVCVARALL